MTVLSIHLWWMCVLLLSSVEICCSSSPSTSVVPPASSRRAVTRQNTVQVTIVLTLDRYPAETGWSLTCDSVEYANVPMTHYGAFSSEQTISESFDIPEQAVCEFVIVDSYGDGICCSPAYGQGSYEIYRGGGGGDPENNIASGGDFGSQETITFVAKPPTESYAFVLHLDHQPEQTGWSLVCDGVEIDSATASAYTGMMNQIIRKAFELSIGSTCQLTVMDTGDNGLCCSAGNENGYYQWYHESTQGSSVLLYNGAEFGSMDQFSFTVESPVPPTAAPTQYQECAVIDSVNFNICIDSINNGSYSSDWTILVQQAKSKWESVISSDTNQPAIMATSLQNLNIPICNQLPPFLDDIYICVQDLSIDGPGGILGQSEITAVSSQGKFPLAGYIRFDSDDLQTLIDSGGAYDIALHEIGHLLGVGSMWSSKNLVSYNNTEWIYTGQHACEQWANISNCTGACPPVENSVQNGVSSGRHWDEASMDHELMTSYAEPGGAPNPLSRVTIGTLEDLGYSVSYDMADDYPSGYSIALCTTTGARDRYLKGSRRRAAPKLSEAGLEVARKHGERLLQKGKAGATLGGNQNVEYAGGQHINIVYEEDNVIYFVDVQTLGGG